MFPIRDHNPSARIAYVTYGLIAVNILIYLWGLATLQSDQAVGRLYFNWALIPALISEGTHLHGFVSSMFLHGGLMHLAGNMLFLWIFGDNLEDEMGHLPFLAFYLASGIGAGGLQYLTAPWDNIPIIGASGAIAGVMGGYLLLFPRARVDIFIFLIVIFKILPIPAWLMLGLWFGLQLLNGLSVDTSAGGVAYWAHAGGFLVGLGLTVPLWLRRGATRFWARTDGHPPHPEAVYRRSNVPLIRRR